MRKLVSIDNQNTGRKITIYRNAEYNEWVVRFFEGGVHLKEADHHTDDSADAYDTANSWVNKSGTSLQSLVPPVLV